MAKRSIQPFSGSLLVDLSALAGVIVDAAPGVLKSCKREGKGLDGVLLELGTSIPAHGAVVGVAQEVYTRIMNATSRLVLIRAAKEEIGKLYEVLCETEALVEDEREADIGIVVSAVRRVAQRKDDSVLAPFEKTLRYIGQVQTRGAKTRAKNVAAAKAAEEAAAKAAEDAAAESPAEAEATDADTGAPVKASGAAAVKVDAKRASEATPG